MKEPYHEMADSRTKLGALSWHSKCYQTVKKESSMGRSIRPVTEVKETTYISQSQVVLSFGQIVAKGAI